MAYRIPIRPNSAPTTQIAMIFAAAPITNATMAATPQQKIPNATMDTVFANSLLKDLFNELFNDLFKELKSAIDYFKFSTT